MLGLALIGLADASFLAASHWNGHLPNCSITDQCDDVLKSAYSTIGPIPVALLGAVYYLALTVMLGLFFDGGKKIWLQLAGRLTIAGLAAAVYFVTVMAYILKAYCQYCLLSAGTSTLLFIIGMIVLAKLKKGDGKPAVETEI